MSSFALAFSSATSRCHSSRASITSVKSRVPFSSLPFLAKLPIQEKPFPISALNGRSGFMPGSVWIITGVQIFPDISALVTFLASLTNNCCRFIDLARVFNAGMISARPWIRPMVDLVSNWLSAWAMTSNSVSA